MENNSIPYVVYESTQAKNERTVRRLVIALIITIIFMFVSNIAWLWTWTQYDYVGVEDTVTYSQDGSRFNNINTGEQGDLSWLKD